MQAVSRHLDRRTWESKGSIETSFGQNCTQPEFVFCGVRHRIGVVLMVNSVCLKVSLCKDGGFSQNAYSCMPVETRDLHNEHGYCILL